MGSCEWCRDAPAVTSVELKPERKSKDKRTGVTGVKPARTLRVCRECKTTVERSKERAEQ